MGCSTRLRRELLCSTTLHFFQVVCSKVVAGDLVVVGDLGILCLNAAFQGTRTKIKSNPETDRLRIKQCMPSRDCGYILAWT